MSQPGHVQVPVLIGFPIELFEMPAAALGDDLYRAGEDVVVRPDGIVAARVPWGSSLDLARLVAAH